MTEVVNADQKTLEWRAGVLRRAGVPADWANEAAAEPHLDIYRVVELIERGATPRQALEIVR